MIADLRILESEIAGDGICTRQLEGLELLGENFQKPAIEELFVSRTAKLPI